MSLDGDTLAVGAFGEDSCQTTISTSAATDNDCKLSTLASAGAVYVFTRSGTTWTFQAYIKSPNAKAAGGVPDNFGRNVALSGDTLVVGTYEEDSCSTAISTSASTDTSCSSAGAAYVFTRSGTTWTFQAYVKAPNAEAGDRFGRGMVLSGDTLAVAAHREDSCQTTISTSASSDNSCSKAGAIYVFKRSGTTWAFQDYVKAPNAGAGDELGLSMALSGNTLAVNSGSEDSCSTTTGTSASTDDSCSAAGAAYVFLLPQPAAAPPRSRPRPTT